MYSLLNCWLHGNFWKPKPGCILLKYELVLRSSHQKNHVEKLQKIQNSFVKSVGMNMYYDFKEIPVSNLEKLRLLSLEWRKNKLIFAFIMNRIIDYSKPLELVKFRITVKTRPHIFTTSHHTSNHKLLDIIQSKLSVSNRIPQEL